MPLNFFRLLLCMAALTPLLAVFDANAVVLGELRSNSRLGELLHAVIEVEEDLADRFDASCVKLYRPVQAGGDFPWVTEGRFSFRRESGQGKLYLSSDHPLRDPVVQIGVQSTCPGGRVWRDYTFLVSPVDSGVAVPSPAAPRTLKAITPQIPVDRSSLRISSEPAQASALLQRHKPRRGAVGVSGASSDPVLRMALEMRVPAEPSEAERDLLRLEYRTLSALYEQTASQLDLAEKLRRLTHDASALKAAGERLGVASTVVPVVVPASVPEALPAPVSAAVLEKSEPPVLPLAVAPAPAAIEPVPPKAAAPRVIPKARTETIAEEEGSGLIDWPLYAGLGTAVLLVLLLVMRRRRAAAKLDIHFLPMHAPTVVVDAVNDFSQPQQESEAAPVIIADAVSVPVPQVPQDIPPPPETIEVNPVMELAEIMLSFGRVQGAAQALQEYIEANPKAALQPWIRLLEIYQGNGMRAEFEALATNLNQNFNVEIVHWDEAMPGERIEMTLELLPHIRDQIDAMWGSPECLAYLDQLLHDNRDGQRNGFALPVVKEILTLIDMMVAEKATAK
jgi:Tfp pilus assembly protein FimV